MRIKIVVIIKILLNSTKLSDRQKLHAHKNAALLVIELSGSIFAQESAARNVHGCEHALKHN